MYEKNNKIAEFCMILARKIIKIGYPNFYDICPKLTKFPNFTRFLPEKFPNFT